LAEEWGQRNNFLSMDGSKSRKIPLPNHLALVAAQKTTSAS